MTRWLLACALLWPTIHPPTAPSPAAAPQRDAQRRTRSGTARLELTIRPTLATDPGAIRVTAFVERHSANRALTLAAICPDYLRRSTIQLDGADAARKHTIVFESLPACTYDISATLHRRDGDDLVEVLVAKVVR